MRKIYILQLSRHCLWEDIFKSSDYSKVLYYYLELKDNKNMVRIVEVSVL